MNKYQPAKGSKRQIFQIFFLVIFLYSKFKSQGIYDRMISIYVQHKKKTPMACLIINIVTLWLVVLIHSIDKKICLYR